MVVFTNRLATRTGVPTATFRKAKWYALYKASQIGATNNVAIIVAGTLVATIIETRRAGITAKYIETFRLAFTWIKGIHTSIAVPILEAARAAFASCSCSVLALGTYRFGTWRLDGTSGQTERLALNKTGTFSAGNAPISFTKAIITTIVVSVGAAVAIKALVIALSFGGACHSFALARPFRGSSS